MAQVVESKQLNNVSLQLRYERKGSAPPPGSGVWHVFEEPRKLVRESRRWLVSSSTFKQDQDLGLDGGVWILHGRRHHPLYRKTADSFAASILSARVDSPKAINACRTVSFFVNPWSFSILRFVLGVHHLHDPAIRRSADASSYILYTRGTAIMVKFVTPSIKSVSIAYEDTNLQLVLPLVCRLEADLLLSLLNRKQGVVGP